MVRSPVASHDMVEPMGGQLIEGLTTTEGSRSSVLWSEVPDEARGHLVAAYRLVGAVPEGVSPAADRYAYGVDQKVNVPDITVVASTDASTRATLRSVSAAMCSAQPG